MAVYFLELVRTIRAQLLFLTGKTRKSSQRLNVSLLIKTDLKRLFSEQLGKRTVLNSQLVAQNTLKHILKKAKTPIIVK